MTLGNLFGGLGSFQSMSQAQHQNLLVQAKASQMAIQNLNSLAPLSLPNQLVSPSEEIDVEALPLETKFGEIVGWRAWKFRGGQLTSPYTGLAWPAQDSMKANHATKEQTPFVSPGGFFAHKKPEGVFEQESDWTAVGTVFLWGDVVEHEFGYRAQHARIVSLDFFTSATPESFKAWLKQEYENGPPHP